jgi:putative transposase
MARIARVVAPGVAHHITQRGNRRQRTFFADADYEAYLALMAAWCARYGVAVWAWCLMPNHVHLIVVPPTKDSLARALGEAHRRYTRHVNFRKGWRGYLWQGRFASYPMDAAYTLAAARYVERNPVRAGLVKRAWEWPWSSAAAHVAGRGDGLVLPKGPLVAEVNDWRRFLETADDEATGQSLRLHARTGRPLGESGFLKALGKQLGRALEPGRRGRPTKKVK